jgi:hypothetical protein
LAVRKTYEFRLTVAASYDGEFARDVFRDAVEFWFSGMGFPKDLHHGAFSLSVRDFNVFFRRQSVLML